MAASGTAVLRPRPSARESKLVGDPGHLCLTSPPGDSGPGPELENYWPAGGGTPAPGRKQSLHLCLVPNFVTFGKLISICLFLQQLDPRLVGWLRRQYKLIHSSNGISSVSLPLPLLFPPQLSDASETPPPFWGYEFQNQESLTPKGTLKKKLKDTVQKSAFTENRSVVTCGWGAGEGCGVAAKGPGFLLRVQESF